MKDKVLVALLFSTPFDFLGAIAGSYHLIINKGHPLIFKWA